MPCWEHEQAPPPPPALPAGTAWWRDGGNNFTVPLPGPRAAPKKDPASAFEDELSRIIVDCEVGGAQAGAREESTGAGAGRRAGPRPGVCPCPCLAHRVAPPPPAR